MSLVKYLIFSLDNILLVLFGIICSILSFFAPVLKFKTSVIPCICLYVCSSRKKIWLDAIVSLILDKAEGIREHYSKPKCVDLLDCFCRSALNNGLSFCKVIYCWIPYVNTIFDTGADTIRMIPLFDCYSTPTDSFLSR